MIRCSPLSASNMLTRARVLTVTFILLQGNRIKDLEQASVPNGTSLLVPSFKSYYKNKVYS